MSKTGNSLSTGRSLPTAPGLATAPRLSLGSVRPVVAEQPTQTSKLTSLTKQLRSKMAIVILPVMAAISGCSGGAEITTQGDAGRTAVNNDSGVPSLTNDASTTSDSSTEADTDAAPVDGSTPDATTPVTEAGADATPDSTQPVVDSGTPDTSHPVADSGADATTDAGTITDASAEARADVQVGTTLNTISLYQGNLCNPDGSTSNSVKMKAGISSANKTDVFEPYNREVTDDNGNVIGLSLMSSRDSTDQPPYVLTVIGNSNHEYITWSTYPTSYASESWYTENVPLVDSVFQNVYGSAPTGNARYGSNYIKLAQNIFYCVTEPSNPKCTVIATLAQTGKTLPANIVSPATQALSHSTRLCGDQIVVMKANQ